MNKWIYKGHNYKDKVQGHIYLGDKKEGACTITLVPAASMTQEELDRHGKAICEAINFTLPHHNHLI